MTSFFNNLGIEAHEVAVLSPIIHATIKTLEGWMELLRVKINEFNGPPDNFIPGCFLNQSTSSFGPKIFKYQSMLDPKNTPFV